MKRRSGVLRRMFENRNAGIFRRIPLNIAGRLYTSPMPTGAYDRGGRLLSIYKKNRIDHVFSLVTDAELEKKAKRNLFAEYGKRGITSSRYIIEDFQAPSLEIIEHLIHEALERLNDGQRMAVHCHAGVGRTSVSVCCIVMALEKIPAREAIEYVKRHMMVDITAEQMNLIEKFERFHQV